MSSKHRSYQTGTSGVTVKTANVSPSSASPQSTDVHVNVQSDAGVSLLEVSFRTTEGKDIVLDWM